MFLLIDICTSKRNKYLLQRSIQDEQDLLELNAAKEKMVQNQSFFFFYCCCCFCDCHALFTVMSCTLDCHALVTVMHFLLKTEDFVQNRLPILHFWLRKKVYSEQNPPHLVVSWHSSAAFLPNFWLFPSPRVQHCYKNTSQLNFLCSLPVLQVWWTFDGVAGQNLDLA